MIDGWEVLAAWKQSVGSSVGARTDVIYVNAASVLIKAPCQQTVSRVLDCSISAKILGYSPLLQHLPHMLFEMGASCLRLFIRDHWFCKRRCRIMNWPRARAWNVFEFESSLTSTIDATTHAVTYRNEQGSDFIFVTFR